jgi:hypothetical protein
LLYYECAPRVYDRSRNLSRIESFTQICAATSNDGTHWEKHNGPILKAAERVFNNCSYTFAGGKRSIDAGKPSCSDANLINNYGAGHPSAIAINNGTSDVVWLFYYDSKGDWPDHGVYLVKGEDGLTFANPVKTNLPNGAPSNTSAESSDHGTMSSSQQRSSMGETCCSFRMTASIGCPQAARSSRWAGRRKNAAWCLAKVRSSATPPTISHRCPSASCRRRDTSEWWTRDRSLVATPQARIAAAAALGRFMSCRARSSRSRGVLEYARPKPGVPDYGAPAPGRPADGACSTDR